MEAEMSSVSASSASTTGGPPVKAGEMQLSVYDLDQGR
jgi:hypothetical protein